MAILRRLFLSALLFLFIYVGVEAQTASNSDLLISTISDLKQFKKILKTKTNLLVAFGRNEKDFRSPIKLLNQVAEVMKGKATIVFVSCSDAKKLCKKYKAFPSPTSFFHFNKGNFNKEYDRRFTLKSFVKFLQDPTGESPWDEDETAGDVIHVDTPQVFYKQIRKSKIPTLVMFYAQWCGYCKQLKPEYAAAATAMRGRANLLAIDLEREEQIELRSQLNITGYPTLLYFENGQFMFRYGGEFNKNGIIDWLKDPAPPKQPEKEPDWADEDTDVIHLGDSDFDSFISGHSSVLVMFYAPWCGYCKRMKPDYTKAAAQLKEDNVNGVLAAVDATKATTLGSKYSIKGYPSVKYFKDGEFAYDVHGRTQAEIVAFMKDPKEPPPPASEEQNWADVESAIQHLNNTSFKVLLRKKKHALVMFYAPWCGHCKKAKPEFNSAATRLRDNTKVMFAAVDCTQFSQLCSIYSITGYPTFKYFNYGKDTKDYNGERQEDDFVAFMSDPESPSPKPKSQGSEEFWASVADSKYVHLLKSDSLDQFLEENSEVLIMFYAPWCGHCMKMKPAFAEAAKTAHGQTSTVFAAVDATSDVSLSTRYDIKGYPSLKYFKNTEFQFDYTGARTAADLLRFARNPQSKSHTDWSSEPSAIHHLTSDTFESFVDLHSEILAMFYVPWCGHCRAAKPEFQAAADEWSGKNNRVFAAVDCTQYKELCKKYEVEGYPTILYLNEGQRIATFGLSRTKQSFLEFIQNPPKHREEL